MADKSGVISGLKILKNILIQSVSPLLRRVDQTTSRFKMGQKSTSKIMFVDFLFSHLIFS